MASMSVKDRAKMFGNLASPNGAEKDKSYRPIGKVNSSPFRSTNPPNVAPAITKSFSTSTPLKSQNFSTAFSKQEEKKYSSTHLRTNSPEEKNDMDWPDEDGIPSPDENKNTITSFESVVAPTNLNSHKFSNSSSPFKVLDNEDNQGRLPSFDSSKSKLDVGNSSHKTIRVMKQQFKPQNSGNNSMAKNPNKSEPSNLSRKKAEKSATVDALSNDSSRSNQNENKFPVNGNNRNKSTRAMRLMKARRAAPSPMVSKNLKQSLQAAKVVMQEEKSDVSASDTSSRSSLTNKELSDIATRALKKAKNNIQNELEENKGNDLSLNIIANQEARLALLNVTASRKKKTIEGSAASERLGLKASRAVAMKNSTKVKPAQSPQNGMDIVKTLSTHSNDSGKSRRMEHPAFTKRPVKANISSAHILASFRQFNAARQSLPRTKQKQVTSDSSAIDEVFPQNKKEFLEDELEQTFSADDDSLRSRTSLASLEQEETMHSVRAMPENSMHSFKVMPGESMSSMGDRRGESIHSNTARQGRSIHSTSGRKDTDHFYHTGRMHITSNNNCNDTVISSLSGNTQSLQSTMSQSIASKKKSPTHRNSQQTPFLLDPTPEHPSQTMKSELVGILSPGPSNRSGHSIANSIISASPKADYRSPSLRDRVKTSFMDTLEENHSSSQESAGNSAELLDAALEAAIEDMEIIDSPRNFFKINNIVEPDTDNHSRDISILPSSSSGRSQSPPGFIFKDSEESDVVVPPDPVGKGFVHANAIIDKVNNASTTLKKDNENSDRSTYVQIKEHRLKEVNASVDFDDVNQENEIVFQKQGSTSTKKTVSTSIRSGMSSIQNGSFVEIIKSDLVFEGADRETNEGSTSIRTGLSGLQKDSTDMDRSISIHTYKNEMTQNDESCRIASNDDNETDNDKESGSHNKTVTLSQYPDTIHEENEDKSTQKSTISLKDENASFLGLKVRSTATTDGSSGTTTGASSSSDQVFAEPSNDDINPGNDTLNSININTCTGITCTGIQNEEDAGEETSNNAFSLLSPGSRSSRPWKNNFGKSIGNAIKTVLAKASPRGNGHTSIRSSQSKRQENEESESLLDDDDDDIFGGLEIEPDEKVVKSSTQKKHKIDEKTPRQKNFILNEKKEVSISRRSNESLSRRANESFSRRANGSLSRRSNESKARKSNETGSNRKINKSGSPHSNALKGTPSTTPSQQRIRIGSTSLYSNDRSGTIVDESEVVHNVNSDITSSLIEGPVSGPSPFQKAMREASKLIEFGDQNQKEISKEIRESSIRKEETEGESFTLLMEESVSSPDVQDFTLLMEESVSSPDVQEAPTSTNEEIFEPKEEETMDVLEVEDEEENKPVTSMFLNFGCGLVDPCSGFANLCTPANKDDNDLGEEIITVGGGDKDHASVGSHSQLTSLEKKVWNKWDRLNDGVISVEDNKSANEHKKDDYDTKREAARDKLLVIANTAISSQVSVKSGKSILIEDDQCTKTTVSEEGNTLSASGSNETGFTKESESGASSNSFGNSLTSDGESFGSFSQEDSSREYSTSSYTSGEESDAISKDRSRSSNAKTTAQTASPILLSFSQRSLMEKFSKQLTAVGVQVLKLNTRKQWQTRYFTVSTEQIALLAHEAISKTGEIAQCPKALLWLKKFNPKNGGYGIINIDKDGHGGMLLVDLIDIQVSDRKDDMLGNPIPKKQLDAFENSVLVTLKYKMRGILRSIEFRCRDNDEAQFLCTCMRVIRDLLRRERSLRQKLSKQTSSKNTTQEIDES